MADVYSAVKHLEVLKTIVQAARDTDYTSPNRFTDGITTGLRIALDAIDVELVTARRLEATGPN
jgi:hypothetical protein